MAAKKISLAEELLQAVSPMPYKILVSNINEEDALSLDTFKTSRWANYFTVDTSRLVTNGRANPNHLYDLFGSFSGNTGSEVRVKLLQHIIDELPFYEVRSLLCLQARSINFETWVETVNKSHCYCDELALIGLCHLYRRHCVVLTANKLWSTIQTDHPMKLLDILNECSIRLVYLGSLRFGVLTWSPRLPKKVATKSPSFNIVEEYTLEEEDVLQKPAAKPVSVSLHVETGSSSSQSVSVGVTPNQPTSNVSHNIAAHSSTHHAATNTSEGTVLLPSITSADVSGVATSTAPTELLHVGTTKEDSPTTASIAHVPDPVTHSSNVNVPSEYPWKKDPVIKLTSLSDLDMDIWCGKVHEYYQYVPPLQIKIVSVKGARKQSIKSEIDEEELPQVDKTKELLDHAHDLLEQAKVFATKLVTDKQREKTGTKPKPPNKGKKATNEALASLHDSTIENLAPLHVETDGSTAAVKESSPKRRKVKCKMCPSIFSTVRDLNNHHREDHGIVKCQECNKAFNNQTSLDKHSYVHKELKFNCEQCGERFPFESRLEQHRMTHINARLSCPKKNCPRTFKSVGDVNRHVKSHGKGGWHRCAHCDYKNKDKRNTESHMRTHTKQEDGKYICDKCGKHMRYSTQFRRHKEQGCEI